MSSPATKVVAAFVERGGRILLARRGPGQNDSGLWELPGGKLEPGEDARTALARELFEEFGIVAEIEEGELARNESTLRGRRFDFIVLRAEFDPEAAELRVHDALEFIAPEELHRFPAAPLDGPVLEVWIAERTATNQGVSNRM
ncbi:MAG: NUDIX domain-containing protein [Spirochaetes bacterium]|nr:NUDIX domain-containing protein [Spirochaetota bacterium]